MNTKDRAKFALRTIKRYKDIRGTDESDLETNVTDLLTDLRHLCDAKSFDFAKLDRMAYSHYSVEVQELGSAGG